jgi:hypothetical protein
VKNNIKMLLEELLPFYFLLMILVIMFTAYVPTTFELFIVYGYAFGVIMFNNRLYKNNMALLDWKTEALDMVGILENENVALRKKVAQMHYEMEWMRIEGNSDSFSNNDGDRLSEESETTI